ncbi:MAG: isocitrate lyase/PEP mutase family protein [Candidatus Binataceae bacterium]|nr:isocitrate lyase/PEP mutase family protein [Candidatus Binataceae bacterium]
MMNESRLRLRQALDCGRPLVAPFVYDGLTASLARTAGFEAVYMTGFGTAAARGYPDLGLLTMSEMVDNVRVVARASRLPVICDADTGYGNPINVWRTVQEYEDAGAAALHLEDQVWPKRCGFMAGKQVVPLETMVPKIRAACDARRDPNLVIIARTDALAPHGWTEAQRRARAYRAAGADVIFVDGIVTLDDLHQYSETLGDLPLLYNGQLLTIPELMKLRFSLIIHISTLFTGYVWLRDAYAELKRTGTIADAPGFEILPEITDTLGASEILDRAEKYKE